MPLNKFWVITRVKKSPKNNIGTNTLKGFALIFIRKKLEVD
jgi:hypothetical protein